MRIKCDYCGKSATIDLQKVWTKWNYDPKTGSYSKTEDFMLEEPEPIEEDNLHLCERCWKLWSGEGA